MCLKIYIYSVFYYVHLESTCYNFVAYDPSENVFLRVLCN